MGLLLLRTPSDGCTPHQATLFPKGPKSNGLQLAAALSRNYAASGERVELYFDLSTPTSATVRLWTSGAAADYDVTVYRSNVRLEERPSWHVVISRVAHMDVRPGHDDFQCLPLTSMFDLTAPGQYTIVAARRFRAGDTGGSVSGAPVHANELQLTVTPPAPTASTLLRTRLLTRLPAHFRSRSRAHESAV